MLFTTFAIVWEVNSVNCFLKSVNRIAELVVLPAAVVWGGVTGKSHKSSSHPLPLVNTLCFVACHRKNNNDSTGPGRDDDDNAKGTVSVTTFIQYAKLY